MSKSSVNIYYELVSNSALETSALVPYNSSSFNKTLKFKIFLFLSYFVQETIIFFVGTSSL